MILKRPDEPVRRINTVRALSCNLESKADHVNARITKPMFLQDRVEGPLRSNARRLPTSASRRSLDIPLDSSLELIS